MAELGFFLGKDEEQGLVRRVLDAGASLVPDIDYQSPDPVRIDTPKEYEQYRKATRLFFIEHPSFAKVPLEMRQGMKDGRRVFFIIQRNGGPTIELLSSVEFSEGGRSKMNPGFLAHHKTFWNSATQRNEEMPPELLKLYGELSAEAKKMANRENVGVRMYWIGKTVKKRLNAGDLYLGTVVRPQGTVTAQQQFSSRE